MRGDLAVSVKGVSKDFVLPHSKNNSVKHALVNVFARNTKSTQHVLRNISFEVKEGDFFGIVGRNGSGKSTLLKILAGVYSPTTGEATLHGTLTPFIELGVGFNPELSGRDNVFLNGALLGFTRKQMEDMYEDIVEFAELERFMDQKLKNYSSGMQVRLAFSIAIKARNDIFIFDEVLAVGDEAFQRKCLDVFEKYRADGQTVILVTHDMDTVRKFCNRALLIDDGVISVIGKPHEVAAAYSKANMKEIEKDMSKQRQTTSDHKMKVSYCTVMGQKSNSFECGDFIDVNVDYDSTKNYAYLVLNIFKRSGEHITGFRVPANDGRMKVRIEGLFAKGKYNTVIQPIDSKDAAIGGVFTGPEFIISTDRVPGRPGWSGLVPVGYEVIDS